MVKVKTGIISSFWNPIIMQRECYIPFSTIHFAVTQSHQLSAVARNLSRLLPPGVGDYDSTRVY